MLESYHIFIAVSESDGFDLSKVVASHDSGRIQVGDVGHFGEGVIDEFELSHAVDVTEGLQGLKGVVDQLGDVVVVYIEFLQHWHHVTLKCHNLVPTEVQLSYQGQNIPTKLFHYSVL